jgi:uncharacterized protein YndB with AHSA1/START domain
MTTPPPAAPAAPLEKVFTIDISAPIERVWQEITRRGSLSKALFNTVLHCQLKPGSPLSYRSKSGRHAFIVGQVVEVTPPTRFVHTFRFTSVPDAPTLVTWELTPMGSGTRITLTHSRFEGQTKTYKMVSGGWVKILSLLKDVLERGDVPRSTRLKYALMGATMWMLPKSMRAANFEECRTP